MALLNSRASKVAVKAESTYKEVLTFADSDVISYTSASFTPSTEEITREYINADTLLAGKSLQGEASTSGSIAMEVVPDATTSTKLAGHVLYDASLGNYNAAGATITATGITDNTAASDGDSGLYYLDNSATKSFGIKSEYGGQEATSVDIRGAVVSSWKLSFPSQAIVTSDFSIEAGTGFIPVATGTALAENCSSKVPVVARGMIVLADGTTTLCATDINITVDNTTNSFVCVTQTGASNKAITQRKISGDFKIAFENLDQLNAFNAASDFALFVSATSLDGNVFAVEIPVATRTAYDVSDDNGTLVQTINFNVSSACGAAAAKPILVAIK